MSIIYHRSHCGLLTNLLFVLNVIKKRKTKWPPKYEAVTQIVGVSASTSCQLDPKSPLLLCTSRKLDPKSPLLLYPRDITTIAVYHLKEDYCNKSFR